MREWLDEAAADTSDDSDSTLSSGQLTPTSPVQSPQLLAAPSSLPSSHPPSLPVASMPPPPVQQPWALPPSRSIAATHLVHVVTGIHRIGRLCQLVAWGSKQCVELRRGGAAALVEGGSLHPLPAEDVSNDIVFDSLRLVAAQLQRWGHAVQSQAARVVSLQSQPRHRPPLAADVEQLVPGCAVSDSQADACSVWALLQHLPSCSHASASAAALWAESQRADLARIHAALSAGAPVLWGLAALPACRVETLLLSVKRTMRGQVLGIEGAQMLWRHACPGKGGGSPWLQGAPSRSKALLDALHAQTAAEAARCVSATAQGLDLDQALANLQMCLGTAETATGTVPTLHPEHTTFGADHVSSELLRPILHMYAEALQPHVDAVDAWLRRGELIPSASQTWLAQAVGQFNTDQGVKGGSSALPWPSKSCSADLLLVPIVFSSNAGAVLRCGFMVQALVGKGVQGGGNASHTLSSVSALSDWSDPDLISQRQLADEIASVQPLAAAVLQRLGSRLPTAATAAIKQGAMQQRNKHARGGVAQAVAAAPHAPPLHTAPLEAPTGSFYQALQLHGAVPDMASGNDVAVSGSEAGECDPPVQAVHVDDWAADALDDLETFARGLELSTGVDGALSWPTQAAAACQQVQAIDGTSPECALAEGLRQVTSAHCSFIERHMLTVLLFDVDLFRYLRLTRALAFGLHGQLHSMAHSRIVRSCASALEQSAVHAVKSAGQQPRATDALSGVATAKRLAAGASPLAWLSSGSASAELDSALLAFRGMGPLNSTTNEIIHNIASGKMVTVLESLPQLLDLCGFHDPPPSGPGAQPWGMAHSGELGGGAPDSPNDSDSAASAAPVVEINARAQPSTGVGGDTQGRHRQRPGALQHGARRVALARRSAATKLRNVVHSGGSTIAGGSTLSDAASVALSGVLGSAVSGWSSPSGVSGAVAGTLARRKHDMRGQQVEQVATADVVLRRVRREHKAGLAPPPWAVPPLQDCIAPGVTALDIRRQVLWFAQELNLHGEALKQFTRGDVLTGTFSLQVQCASVLASHAAQTVPKHPTTTVNDAVAVVEGTSLCITPPWPLSLVFSPEVISACSKLHSAVFRLAAAADLNGHAQQLMRRAAATLEYSPELRRVALISQAVAHTLQALRNFVCSRLAERAGHGTVAFDTAGAAIEGEVSLDGVASISVALNKRGAAARHVVASALLARSAAVVGRSVASAESIEAVVELFSVHFQQLARSCLLDGVEGPVLDAMQKCIAVCLQLAVNHARVAYAVQYAAEHMPLQCQRLVLQGCDNLVPLFQQLRRVQGRLHRRCAVLHKLVADGSGVQALQGTAASSLMQLMDSIDSNGFLASL